MRRITLVAGTLLAIAVLVVVAWQLDVRRHRDEVMRNVAIAGRDVGGLDEAALRRAAADVARRYEASTIVLHTPKGDRSVAASALGLKVDVDATVARALDEGHDDTQPLPWLASLLAAREAGVVADVDAAAARERVAAEDPTGRREAMEPGITGEGGQVAVVLGRDGVGIDASAVADAIEHAADDGELPIEITAEPGTLHPRFTRADAERLADRARKLTAERVRVRAGTLDAEVTSAQLRSWVTSSATGDDLRFSLDADKTLAGLRELLKGADTTAADARFTIQGGRPVILPGVKGTACCDASAVDMLLAAIERGDTSRLQLRLASVEPEQTTADLEKLRVVEEIGSFTTKHKCCENRVHNIHRIADLVRGVVIDPGERFSVNEFVGKRTTEKGFVVDHVIENGSFSEAVGGGISQFATTTFNAAFFAGLDLKEYQSHSIYISRYPYGREATLSYPKPDLVIGNSTPYGVLIWPTYTDTSLTITLYSTRYAHGEQTAQTQAPVGPNGCTRVTTERTRTYVDGTVKKDKVYAVYRPSEGVQCG